MEMLLLCARKTKLFTFPLGPRRLGYQQTEGFRDRISVGAYQLKPSIRLLPGQQRRRTVGPLPEVGDFPG